MVVFCNIGYHIVCTHETQYGLAAIEENGLDGL